MGKPHKHAELIKAWADGAEIEFYSDVSEMWLQTPEPVWASDLLYRVKQVEIPDGWNEWNPAEGFGVEWDEECVIGFDLLLTDGTAFTVGVGDGIPSRDLVAWRPVIRLEEPEKVVRYQWVVTPVGCDFPVMINRFFTDEEFYQWWGYSTPGVVGRAEWTMMEFDK